LALYFPNFFKRDCNERYKRKPYRSVLPVANHSRYVNYLGQERKMDASISGRRKIFAPRRIDN
jgi:hypothetical protein